MTFFDKLLIRGIKENANGIALECDEKSYTYKELEQKVVQLADYFSKYGIGKGDKVIILHEHPLKFSLILLAMFYLEAVPLPVYSKTGRTKLEGMIKFYDVNYVIKSNENSEIDFGNERKCNNEFERVSDIVKIVASDIYHMCSEKDDDIEQVKIILFTSGTTSTPKGIMLSEKNICSNVAAISDYLVLDVQDNILLIKDLRHSSSIIGELLVGLYNGCKIVMTTQLPLAAIILKLMERQKISVFFAVPTILNGIMTYSKLGNYDLSHLRIINFYGASMNYRDIEALIGLFPDTNIIYSYGQTEASPRVTYIQKQDLLRKPASCGKPIRNVSVCIVNAEGKEVLPLVRGEIVVSGPNVMLGYYRNSERTAQVKINNSLHTRDLGYVDEDGFLYVTGRLDNMIISAGKNIYPEEIEGVLTSYNGILEALCIGQKKDNNTNDLVAYIVLKQGVELELADVFAYCEQNLEIYKIPKKLIVVDKLEKTPSGKIVRNR